MSRIQRIIVALVLAIALPFQGVAAATMAACEPSHHPVERVTQAHGSFDQHGQLETVTDGSDQTSPHSHEKSLAGEQAPVDHDAVPGSLDKNCAHKCSACAPCSAAAIPSPFVTLESVALSESFAPLEPSGTTAFLSEGLERPPRPVLA